MLLRYLKRIINNSVAELRYYKLFTAVTNTALRSVRPNGPRTLLHPHAGSQVLVH